jgi:glycosyltransferase involved in cell wall biosynthesis
MKDRKKKLLIVGSSQGGYGGIEAFMIAVAETAMSWPEFDVRLCFKIVKGYALKEDLQAAAKNVCSQVYFTNRGSKELLKLISWSDVLHIQNTPPDVIFPAYIRRKRIFLTIHNWRKRTDSLHYLLWGVAAKLAHQRWFNSSFVWSTWEPQKKSPNSACVPTVCRFPSAWCPPESRKGFLFVGRWIENKGIEELITAYAKCKFNATEWPLTILGSGPLKPKILSLLQDLNISTVQMPGFVSDSIKAQLMASAKWLLAPANTKEDLGLTPIEARCIGVPSIVTRDGGLPEAGGEAALIAEPGNVDDLIRCMQHAKAMNLEEYKRRSELAKSSLEQFLKPMDFYRKAYCS